MNQRQIKLGKPITKVIVKGNFLRSLLEAMNPFGEAETISIPEYDYSYPCLIFIVYFKNSIIHFYAENQRNAVILLDDYFETYPPTFVDMNEKGWYKLLRVQDN